MKKRVLKVFGMMVLVIGILASINAVAPSVGLYWVLNSDPTAGAGQSAPQNQLLFRTDVPSIYYKSGAANTAWTQLGIGGGGGAVSGTLNANTLPVANCTVGTCSTVTNSHLVDDAVAGSITSSEDFVVLSTKTMFANTIQSIVGGGLTLNSATTDVTVNDGVIVTSGAVKNTTSGVTEYLAIAEAYGDGHDGTCSFDGSTTPVAGATLSGSTYTLTRDIYCSDATVSTGVTINCGTQPTAVNNYFRFNISKTLTFNGTGHIDCNGTNGGNGAVGAGGTVNGGYNASNLCSAGNGGAGGFNGNGTASTNQSAVILNWGALSTTAAAAAGANGTACSGTGQGGGGGGAQTTNTGGGAGSLSLTATNGGGMGPYSLFQCTNEGTSTTHLNLGCGGGGGGGVATGGGGAGGSAGGMLVLRAKVIVCSGAGNMNAKGGNGGNGHANGGGGGGGGGGGYAVIRYSHSSGCTAGSSTGLTDPANTNISVVGGTKGTKGGTAGDGANGCDGTKNIINMTGDGT